MYLLGQSAGWLRFYVYEVVFGLLLLAYCLQPRVIPLPVRARWAALCFVVIPLLVWSNTMTWKGLDDHDVVYSGESEYLRMLAAGGAGASTYPHWEIGSHFRDVLFTAKPEALVLIDDQQATDIVLFSARPGRFVTPSASQFNDYLSVPVGNIDYILVPKVSSHGQNLILDAYPDLFEEGAPFVTLEREFTGRAEVQLWRLYRVLDLGKALPQDKPAAREER